MVLDGLVDELNALRHEAISRFVDETLKYKNSVVEQKLTELNQFINMEFTVVAKAQSDLIRRATINSFKKAIPKLTELTAHDLKSAQENALKSFESKVEGMCCC